MSKEQEALDKIRKHCLASPSYEMGEEFGFGQDYDLHHDGYEDEVETLQELVDRSKLAKGSMSFGGCYCNNCDYRLGDHNGWTQATVKFCSNCGKPLDWSNDEPTK